MELHIRNPRQRQGLYSAKIQPLLHSSLDGLWSINEPVCWHCCASSDFTMTMVDRVHLNCAKRWQCGIQPKCVPVWIVSWPPSNLLAVWCQRSTGESECNKHTTTNHSGVKSIFTLKWISFLCCHTLFCLYFFNHNSFILSLCICKTSGTTENPVIKCTTLTLQLWCICAR